MATNGKPAEFIHLARIAVVAVAADDELQPVLVLKGGTAIQLIHQVGFRASQDIDFSIRDGNDEDRRMDQLLSKRLQGALESRFDAAGYDAFDFEFQREGGAENSGYTALIRVIERGVAEKKVLDLVAKGRGPTPDRVRDLRRMLGRQVKIELSKREHVEGNVARDIEGFEVRVYTPTMIVAEKLRALCQQMPGQRIHPTARARDFYDVHALVVGATRVDLDLKQSKELVAAMFEAKDVPITLLGRLAETREFHRTSWESVRNSVVGEQLAEFDFYFDFVVSETKKLQTLWVSNSPA